jgi:hypothetical protein
MRGPRGTGSPWRTLGTMSGTKIKKRGAFEASFCSKGVGIAKATGDAALGGTVVLQYTGDVGGLGNL